MTPALPLLLGWAIAIREILWVVAGFVVILAMGYLCWELRRISRSVTPPTPPSPPSPQ